MPVSFTGSLICSNLSATAVLVNTGTATIMVTSSSSANYDGCSMIVRDHAGNGSNSLPVG